MSVSTKLGDEFLRIPKLEVSGTNRVIFNDRFTWALDARGILDHIDGSGKEPDHSMVPEPADKSTPLTGEEAKKAEEEQTKLDVEWKKEVKEWKQGEAIAKQ